MATMNEAISMLVAEDPETQAARLLAKVVSQAQASGGAVFGFGSVDISVFASRSASMMGIQRGRELWIERRNEMAPRGGVTKGNDSIFHLGRGGEPVGLLYLEGGRLDREDVEAFLVALGAAVASGGRREVTPPRDLTHAHVGETREQRLVRTLREVEWNLAFAARRLGVSRRTVYLWCQRYGLKRPERGSRRGEAFDHPAITDSP